jgi:hypothetical protein
MNGFPIVATGVIVVLLLGFLYWRRKRTWTTVYEGVELTEQASDQFALLQDNGIRCRMRNKTLHSSHNAGFVESPDSIQSRIVIDIHQDDVKKAKRLLEQRVSGQYEFNLESS